MYVTAESGFGTVSSALIALPASPGGEPRAVWLHTAGRPGEAPFEAVRV